MPRRTAEANKAVLSAWKNEQELVSEGKGTRDWTPEQQKDILEYGKAYNEDGKAFEGQHMKSVEKYPEHQGNPNNIQFLTKEEHLEAHKGSWKTPTNWYYNPTTKQFLDFGEDDLFPCAVIELSKPVICFDECNMDEVADEVMQVKEKPSPGTNPPIKDCEQSIESEASGCSATVLADTNQVPTGSAIGSIKIIAKVVKEFSDKHPIAATLLKVGVGAVGTYIAGKAIGAVSKTKQIKCTDHTLMPNQTVEAIGRTVADAISGFDFKKSESFLKARGYTVAKNIGLSDADRQKLLKEIITNGKILKEAVCTYLEFNINLHKNQSNFAEAVSKWASDLAYIRNNL